MKATNIPCTFWNNFHALKCSLTRQHTRFWKRDNHKYSFFLSFKVLLSCLSKAWLIYDANMASLSFLTDVQCDDLCRSEISISVVRMCSLHVSSRDRSRSSASLRLVSKEGQARAFSRLGFKGCYHLFCQIQQSPAL